MSEYFDDLELEERGILMYDRKKKNARDTEYKKRSTTLITVRLTHTTDADILAYLQTISNKQGLIKGLLRQHMVQDGFVYTPPEE